MPAAALPAPLRTSLLLAAVLSCKLHPTAGGDPPLTLPPVPANALRVLFVGNSLTYVNDLPGTLADLAKAAGQRELYHVSIAFPDFSLEDHLAQGDAARALRAQDWDFVVMQQGPSSLPGSRVQLERDVRRLAPLVRQAKAVPSLFMVWPGEDRKFAFPDVRDSYRAAAVDVEGLFLPAGMAWLEAWQRDPSLVLYADGLHPTPMATWLTALTIFQRLYGISPLQLSVPTVVNGVRHAWPDSVVRLLKEAAAAANATEGHP